MLQSSPTDSWILAGSPVAILRSRWISAGDRIVGGVSRAPGAAPSRRALRAMRAAPPRAGRAMRLASARAAGQARWRNASDATREPPWYKRGPSALSSAWQPGRWSVSLAAVSPRRMARVKQRSVATGGAHQAAPGATPGAPPVVPSIVVLLPGFVYRLALTTGRRVVSLDCSQPAVTAPLWSF